ncbi:ABC transporter substrate-binding protein [Haliangium ochraceum]|nr:ABC transporter substrate-binding protein [Haliangium ochraceum]
MPSQHTAFGAAATLGALLFSGCVLTTTDRNQCRDNLECRDAFGLGATCNADGFCVSEAIDPRCTKTFPDDLLASDERRRFYKDYVVVGSIMQREVALFEKFELSAELAFSRANQSGGVDGRRFGVVYCSADAGYDDGLEAGGEAAAAMAGYLADTMSVPAIFGPATSAETESAFLALEGKNVLLVSPSATSPDLTPIDNPEPSDENPGLLWRTAPPDSFQGEAIAVDMRAPGAGREVAVDTVVVIHIDDTYGNALYQAFASSFESRGGTAISRPFVPNNASQPGARLDEVVPQVGLAGGFDEVLFISSSIDDIVGFLNTSAEFAGYDGKGIFLAEAAASDDVLNVADATRFPQVRGSRPRARDRDSDLVYANFLSAYSFAYKEDADGQVFTANSYDAGWLIAFGVSWALINEGSLDGTSIARGLRRLSSGPTVNLDGEGWATMLESFGNGESININGASGSLDYDNSTEETATEVEIWTISAENEIDVVDLFEP